MINYSLKLYYGTDALSPFLVINENNIVNIERSIESRSDLSLPSFGIMSSGGSVEFKDTTNIGSQYSGFADFLSHGASTDQMSAAIFMGDYQIGYYNKVVGYSKDSKSNIVSLSLKDDLEEWQKIEVQGLEYDRNAHAANVKTRMSDMYIYLKDSTPDKYDMLNLSELDFATRNALTDHYYRYPILHSNTLWAQWQKLCEVCGLYIYKNGSGKTVCFHDSGA